MKKNNAWFSIIEILIWIFIFSLWLTWAYLLLLSTSSMNAYSKNSIIASNLAREWIEIVKNVRDNNYKTLHNWNKFPWTDNNLTFLTWVYYKVENDFNSDSTDWAIISKIQDFSEWKSQINEVSWKMSNYRLYLTPDNTYTYSSNWNTKTYFYRYVKFDDVTYDSGWVMVTQSWALKLKSKVIWYNYWYHEVSLDTIITDWQRQ